MIDVLHAIRHARSDKDLKAKAAAIASDLIEDALAGDHDRTPGVLRGSDSGNCVRQVWADVHGLFDIAEDTDAQLTSMDSGTLRGAWYAALFKVGLEDQFQSVNVHCEYVVDGEMTGHVDAYAEQVVGTGPERDEWEMVPIAAVEIKCTAVMGPPRDPMQPNKAKNSMGEQETRIYQVLQSVSYAVAVGAPTAAVITVSPNGMRQDNYEVKEWAGAVASDKARLSTALGDAEPKGDPQQDFRCKSCRFGKCVRNANPSREVSLVS